MEQALMDDVVAPGFGRYELSELLFIGLKIHGRGGENNVNISMQPIPRGGQRTGMEMKKKGKENHGGYNGGRQGRPGVKQSQNQQQQQTQQQNKQQLQQQTQQQ